MKTRETIRQITVLWICRNDYEKWYSWTSSTSTRDAYKIWCNESVYPL